MRKLDSFVPAFFLLARRIEGSGFFPFTFKNNLGILKLVEEEVKPKINTLTIFFTILLIMNILLFYHRFSRKKGNCSNMGMAARFDVHSSCRIYFIYFLGRGISQRENLLI